jgi:hypothetical protein
MVTVGDTKKDERYVIAFANRVSANFWKIWGGSSQ